MPLQFMPGESWPGLDLTGRETIDIRLPQGLQPQVDARPVITADDGRRRECTLRLRVDTPIEADYLRHGGILPYVLRQLLEA